MAITEDQFTADELVAVITKNPALAAELKTFGTKANYHIRTADEENTFVTGLKTETINSKTSEFANAIEKDIKGAFGVDKLENEKYHDYLKRVAGATTSQLAQMKTELETLKADPDKTGADKVRITQLEAAIQTEKTGATAKLAEKDKAILDLKAGFETERALNKIRATYVLGIPELAIKAVEEAATAQLKARMKEIDGKLLIMDEDGVTPLLDKTTYKPVEPEGWLKEKLADIIDKGRQATGTGQQQQQQQQNQAVEGVVKDAAGVITDITSIPETVKSRVDLHDYLGTLGLTVDSAIFNKMYEKYGAKLPLR